jgi:hypothetical protein
VTVYVAPDIRPRLLPPPIGHATSRPVPGHPEILSYDVLRRRNGYVLLHYRGQYVTRSDGCRVFLPDPDGQATAEPVWLSEARFNVHLISDTVTAP